MKDALVLRDTAELELDEATLIQASSQITDLVVGTAADKDCGTTMDTFLSQVEDPQARRTIEILCVLFPGEFGTVLSAALATINAIKLGNAASGVAPDKALLGTIVGSQIKVVLATLATTKKSDLALALQVMQLCAVQSAIAQRITTIAERTENPRGLQVLLAPCDEMRRFTAEQIPTRLFCKLILEKLNTPEATEKILDRFFALLERTEFSKRNYMENVKRAFRDNEDGYAINVRDLLSQRLGRFYFLPRVDLNTATLVHDSNELYLIPGQERVWPECTIPDQRKEGGLAHADGKIPHFCETRADFRCGFIEARAPQAAMESYSRAQTKVDSILCEAVGLYLKEDAGIPLVKVQNCSKNSLSLDLQFWQED